MIEQIIPPVDPDELERELTPARRLRRTNKSDNEIYVVTGAEAPPPLPYSCPTRP